MTTRTLPEKKYFKIGEVADLVGVEPHVLRYWETQFPQVRPHKARSGHRLYRRREVETLLVIRELLHVQRFTIAGARQALRQPGGAQSLLPRFFDGFSTGSSTGSSTGASSGSAASSIEAPRDTLVPRAVDATDEDGRAGARLAAHGDKSTGDDAVHEHSLFDAPGVDSAEGDVVEVEAHALDREEMRDALERDAAAGSARRTIVEVEVAAEDAPADAAPEAAAEPANEATPNSDAGDDAQAGEGKSAQANAEG